MQFKLSVLATLLAASTSVIAAPVQIGGKATDAVKSLSTDSENLNNKLQSTTGPISIGQAILSGYKDQITEKNKDIAAFGLGGDAEGATQTSTLTSAEQSALCEAITTYVKVDQALLNTVIGEKGLLSSTPFTAPIAAVLRTDEGATDTLMYGLIGYVPTCADSVRPEVESLAKTYQKAISTYSIPF